MKLSKRVVVVSLAMMMVLSMFMVSSAKGPTVIKTRGLVFRNGIRSDQIRLIKDFFRARNEKNVAWGYDYDSHTVNLVRRYQAEKGLNVDGYAGQATLNAMNRDIINYNYKIGPRVPRANVGGNLLVLNKSSNTLHLLQGGRTTRTYPIATGLRYESTPDGKHRIVNKRINPPYYGVTPEQQTIAGGAANNPLGVRWLGISHGGGNLYGIHGNAAPNSIGQYISQGCVRMFNNDVQELFNLVSIGTPVWIGSEDLLQSFGIQFYNDYGVNPRPNKPVAPVKPEEPKEEDNIIDAKLEIDGEEIKLEEPVRGRKGTTYYPFREIIETIDGEVSWDQETRTASAIIGEDKVSFSIGKNQYIVNGETKNLPEGEKPFISKDDKTYIPIRYVMEAFGYEVDWDQATKTVIITSLLEEPELEEPELEDPEENLEENLEEMDEELESGALEIEESKDENTEENLEDEDLKEEDPETENLEDEKTETKKNNL